MRLRLWRLRWGVKVEMTVAKIDLKAKGAIWAGVEKFVIGGPNETMLE